MAAKQDDLEYALEGLGAKQLAVIRTSAVDSVALLADPKARAPLFRSHGVVPNILATLAGAGSRNSTSDALVSLALAGLMHCLAYEPGVPLHDLAPSVLRRLELSASQCDAAPSQPPPTESAVAALWRSTALMCPQCIEAGEAAPAAAELPRLARRLCILSLAACARGGLAPTRAAIRSHPSLHEVPRFIQARGASNSPSHSSLLPPPSSCAPPTRSSGRIPHRLPYMAGALRLLLRLGRLPARLAPCVARPHRLPRAARGLHLCRAGRVF